MSSEPKKPGSKKQRNQRVDPSTVRLAGLVNRVHGISEETKVSNSFQPLSVVACLKSGRLAGQAIRLGDLVSMHMENEPMAVLDVRGGTVTSCSGSYLTAPLARLPAAWPD